MFEPISTVLPEDFDGVVRFTNWTNEDFVGVWGGKNYTFPAMKTTPMVIINATPIELFGIRKKFAKNLAEKMFFSSEKYKQMFGVERNKDNNAPVLNSIHQANTYSLDELTPYIQKCLDPLPLGKASISEVPKTNFVEKLSKDDNGNIVTEAIDGKTSLRKKALEM